MRKVLYQGLVLHQPLLDLLEVDGDTVTVDDRIHQASSLVGVPDRPFITYRMHTDFPREGGIGRREYCQIWANDDPGDYLRIDDILKECRIALESLAPSSISPDFLEARWIETGVDLKDDDMGTINRYIRLQFTGTLRERE